MSKFFFLLIFLVGLPVLAGAQLDYPYPVVPGTTITLTESSTIGETVKYLASWAIIIASLIAFLALIYAGFLYLTSSYGSPEETKEAKSRIINAFLGLLILIGSYIIMLLINPQFMVLRLERTPVDQGIALLTQTGYDYLTDSLPGSKKMSIEEIIQKGEAIFLPNTVSDLRNLDLWGAKKRTFGKLKVAEWHKQLVPNAFGGTSTKCTPTKVDFKNFNPNYPGFLVFWPKSQEDVKVLLHSNTNFKPDHSGDEKIAEYLPEGKLDENGKIIASCIYPLNNPSLEVHQIEPSDFKTVVNFDYEPFPSDCDPSATARLPMIIDHPPLSLKRKPYGPGVYLYSNKVGKDVGPLLKTTSGNFNFRDHWFDNEAVKIELKNENGKYDYLAVLFEKPDWDGDFKIFFEKREGKLRGYKTTDNYGCSNTNICGNYNAPDYNNLSVDPAPRQNNFSMGSNCPGSSFVGKDCFGSIEAKKTSSVLIREIDKPSACKTVWLCTEPNYQGECLIHIHDDSGSRPKPSDYPDVWLGFSKMPFFNIVNLENKPGESIEFKMYDSVSGQEKTPQNFDLKGTFNDKIKSIKIKGNCMVALFQERTDSPNFPGGNSEFFFSSVPNLNLKGYKIHNCKGYHGLLFLINESCASAIAVFPVKK